MKISDMRKVVYAFVVCLTLVLGACKNKVTTDYTIGCLGYQIGSLEGSDWTAIENYFKSTVEFNKIVSFESNSLSQNDALARDYFDTEMAKVDQEYVCSLLKESDYYVYGIATLNAGGEYRIVKAVKFMNSGTSPYEP
jgi:hypothetical protein